jgi:hypothetical protein
MSNTLTSPGSKSAQPAGAERRRSKREPYIMDAWLIPAGQPEARIQVVTLDLSRHGVRLQVSKPLLAESCHALELKANGQRVTMDVVICRCLPMEDGFWDVGAEFC